jgi:hypothetical protein
MRFTAALTAVAVGLVLGSPPAFAAPCSPSSSYHIFWQDLTTLGMEVSWAGGTQGDIRLTNWTLDPCEDSAASSTSHFELRRYDCGADMFEASLQKRHDGKYYYRIAYGICPNETEVASGLLSTKCTVTVGEFYTFRVKWTANVSKWEAHVKCPDGTWKFLGSWEGVQSGDRDGWPMVEVHRLGATTGLSNHHHNLFFRDANNIWYSWANMGCRSDDDPDWNGREVAGDHFETIQQSQLCPRD